MTIRKLIGFIRLIRFELPLSAGICVVMGQLFALGGFASVEILVGGFLSVFMISASILVMNDYFDIETDRVNAPHRPIAANLVSANEAFYFSIVLLVVGLVFSFLLNMFVFGIAIILSIVGFMYNRYFKKQGIIGNLMVSFSVGMTFIYGGGSVGEPFNAIVVFFAIVAGLVDLGEEIAADAMDIKGDLLIDSGSIAIKYGRGVAVWVSFVVFCLVILLSVIPFLLSWFSWIYLFPIVVMDVFIGYSAVRILMSEGEDGRKYIRLLYMGATLGLVFFLVMRLFGL